MYVCVGLPEYRKKKNIKRKKKKKEKKKKKKKKKGNFPTTKSILKFSENF